MDFTLTAFFQAFIIEASCSLDAFTASFAYGSNKVKIPFLCVQIINILCSIILGISLLVGSSIRYYIPSWVTIAITFTILLILGIIKLLESIKEVRKVKRDKKYSSESNASNRSGFTCIFIVIR